MLSLADTYGTYYCKIRTHINTGIHTHTNTPKKKIETVEKKIRQKGEKKRGRVRKERK